MLCIIVTALSKLKAEKHNPTLLFFSRLLCLRQHWFGRPNQRVSVVLSLAAAAGLPVVAAEPAQYRNH